MLLSTANSPFRLEQLEPRQLLSAAPEIDTFIPPSGAFPKPIVAGPDGAVWYGDTLAHQIGRVDRQGDITKINIGGDANGIASGSDGNLWVAEGNQLERITPAGVVTTFAIPFQFNSAGSITAGPDGALWYTEGVFNKIGRMTIDGSAQEFSPPPRTFRNMGQITAGPDGNLWFAAGSNIGRITPTGQFTAFALPSSQDDAVGITVAPDGNLWFTENNSNKIGRITPAGVVTQFDVPTANSHPDSITAGPDGNLWFTENYGGVAKITPSGQITEYPLTGFTPDCHGIVAGADGNIYFVESFPNQIGRVDIGEHLPGDTNGDGTVNFTDLLTLAQHYNSTEASQWTGDFTGDGTVNFADLLILAQNYGKSAPGGAAARPGSESFLTVASRALRARRPILAVVTTAIRSA